MDIKGNSLYQEMQAMMGEINSISPNNIPTVTPNNPAQQNFAELLGDAIGNVNDMGYKARDMQHSFELGEPNISLADVMVAKEKAGIAFEATVQVRNKVLEAYKQIMNMPV
ncbi:flagellar hook-basal body complex protein FliE [Alteromonas sp. 5E99-2]|uniref:flagellar hook-basal body complex protein FliE n=1 Tax=Alteromonas sp. 5E99-2 TaxID=2817683 RepID=UPI001A98E03C|nr:flagellar hook-basal body complex protein FliE [Alteromonas sp. 5E99-2]MBO1255231.1 flagellar hook-basal body complex protein FliE [Alteromonas sp. 5E99-2]